MVSPDTEEPWYTARCVFRHSRPGRGAAHLYEERIVLVQAGSADEAIAKGEREAYKYAEDNEAEYLGFIDTYHLFEKELRPGCEVYSLMRSSDMSPDAFITHYLNDGTQHSRDQLNDRMKTP